MMIDSSEVAARAKVKVASIHWYHKKGMMPKADEFYGRTPVWKEETIETWLAERAARKQPPTADVPK